MPVRLTLGRRWLLLRAFPGDRILRLLIAMMSINGPAMLVRTFSLERNKRLAHAAMGVMATA
jgi:hypothetical protein